MIINQGLSGSLSFEKILRTDVCRTNECNNRHFDKSKVWGKLLPNDQLEMTKKTTKGARPGVKKDLLESCIKCSGTNHDNSCWEDTIQLRTSTFDKCDGEYFFPGCYLETFIDLKNHSSPEVNYFRRGCFDYPQGTSLSDELRLILLSENTSTLDK